MKLVVYSHSRSFDEHINAVVEEKVKIRAKLSPPSAGKGCVYLVHSASFEKELPAWLNAVREKDAVIGVAADIPQVEDLLSFTEIGVKGYFNAYMNASNYAQMLRLLSNGQSWFPPAMLSLAFDMACSVINRTLNTDVLDKLTKREREVALAVAEGKSNQIIAEDCGITERTVKSHLTNIFKKLDIKDRVGLVVLLNQSDAQHTAKTLNG